MPIIKLWEILVPTVRNDGRPIRTRFHRVWDEKVRVISNGLTIMAPSKGQWISPTGQLFLERMIPVRILATKEQIITIIDLTLEYYEQEAVLCYAISDEVILRHKGGRDDIPIVTDYPSCNSCHRMMQRHKMNDGRIHFTCNCDTVYMSRTEVETRVRLIESVMVDRFSAIRRNS